MFGQELQIGKGCCGETQGIKNKNHRSRATDLAISNGGSTTSLVGNLRKPGSICFLSFLPISW